MSDFVKISVAGPGKTLEMSAPVERIMDAIEALAAVLPTTFEWKAEFVPSLALPHGTPEATT